jgi:hypothetical protein
MACPQEDDHTERFVIELLSTGSMLWGVIEDITDALPPDAYPGEELSEVATEMVYGSIATALAAVDPEEVRAATRLIDLAGARVLEHLQLACELSRRMHSDDGSAGRTYG